jgi:hypothetical protein
MQAFSITNALPVASDGESVIKQRGALVFIRRSGCAPHWLIEKGIDKGKQALRRDRFGPKNNVKGGIVGFRIRQAAQNQHRDGGEPSPKKIDELRAVQVGHEVVGNHKPERMEKLRILKHLKGAIGAFGNSNRSSIESENCLACCGLHRIVIDEKNFGIHIWICLFTELIELAQSTRRDADPRQIGCLLGGIS